MTGRDLDTTPEAALAAVRAVQLHQVRPTAEELERAARILHGWWAVAAAEGVTRYDLSFVAGLASDVVMAVVVPARVAADAAEEAADAARPPRCGEQWGDHCHVTGAQHECFLDRGHDVADYCTCPCGDAA